MQDDLKSSYPSLDKRQERFYRKTPIREINVEQTIYEMVFNSNQDNMDKTALEYMGITWSFERLKAETDRVAIGFYKAGLKLGDTVLLGVSNCLEVVVILLALNKLGVISKWFDVRAGEKDIEDYANDSNCRYLIAFDLLLPKIQRILDNTKLEQVLIIYPTDELPIMMQALYLPKAKRLPRDVRYVRFKDFIKSVEDDSDIPCVAFDKNRPSIMIQSSGTTGKPKVIVHSDFSATSCTKALTYCDLPMGEGKTLLDALPPWIAYALGQAIIYPLSIGTRVKLCPTFEPNMVMDNLGTFTISFAAPFHYRYIREHFGELFKKQRAGLSTLECLVSGGDKISAEENKELEKILGTVLINGYGNNEGWGCLTVNPAKYNKYGTVGIPKYGETIIAYDNDIEKELPFGESGEICALTNSTFLYYKGNLKETEKSKKFHSDGKLWLHTGDIGFVDEDGFIILNGRARRVIVRQGFKISAYTIEDKICEHSSVKECVAVEVRDCVEEHVPMAYIVLKDANANQKNVEESIYNKCHKELMEYEIPKYFRIVSSLPYTQNGKYDFRFLEEQGNQYIASLGKESKK